MNMRKLERVMEKGFDLNIVALLYMAKAGEAIISSNLRVAGIVQLMERKGLILDGRITLSGEEVLEFMEEGGEIIKEKEKNDGYEEIYERVVKRMEELTGKKQKRTDIFGKQYNYLPSKYDFCTRLKKVVNKYGLGNMRILEETIIRNIEKCNKSNKWYPLLVYYFVKDDISPLASEYEAWEDNKREIEENYDGTNI